MEAGVPKLLATADIIYVNMRASSGRMVTRLIRSIAWIRGFVQEELDAPANGIGSSLMLVQSLVLGSVRPLTVRGYAKREGVK